jgi:hypothetical protein
MPTRRHDADVYAALGVRYSQFPPIQRDGIRDGLARRFRSIDLFDFFVKVHLELLPAALDDRSSTS